jgi:RNA polymerase sigma-70 factor (ECF subfamily)
VRTPPEPAPAPASPGSREARFKALLEDYGRILRAAIVRHCPRHLGIQFDDVEQDARIRLWRAIEREREIQDPASYLYRVAATATLDAVRRVKARREDPLDTHLSPDEETQAARAPRPEPVDSRVSPERRASERQIVERVQAHMAGLSENRRRALGLYLQGFSTAEIGEVLGWSEAKARNLAYRALKDLRERLRAEGIDDGS